MMKSGETYLFVYGLLRKGCENDMAELLYSSADYIAEGYVNGALYDVGKYPAFVNTAKNARKIFGDLFLVKDKSIIAILDDFEGIGANYEQPYEYARKKVSCYYNDQEVECWIYEYQWPVDQLKAIPSGNYKVHMQQ